MKVCSECRRCFADSTDACTEKVHSALSATRHGDVDVIKGYRLEFLLKSDIAGELYRARQTASNHSCLIRILPCDDQRTTDRFLHEGRIASSMFHPNVVDTYEVGTLPSGELYVVSEDAEGQSLRDLLLNVGVPQLLTSIQVTRQAAEAIHAMHVSELTHRAISPENIILANDSEYRLLVRVRHIDFGGVIERAIVSDKFRIDESIESLKYFAPEQCSAEVTTAAADVYGLGIVFYEMLSGAPPFDATSAAGLIEKHRNKRPADVKIDNFQLRMLVTHTLTESLQKRPDVRHVSANAFARQLRHVEQLAMHSPTPPPAGMNAPGTARSTQVTVVAANPAQPVPPRPITPPTATPVVRPQHNAMSASAAKLGPVKEKPAEPVVVKQKVMAAKADSKPAIAPPKNVGAKPTIDQPTKLDVKPEIVAPPSSVEAMPEIVALPSNDGKPEIVVTQQPVVERIEAKPDVVNAPKPVDSNVEAKPETDDRPSTVQTKHQSVLSTKRVTAKLNTDIGPKSAKAESESAVKLNKPVEAKNALVTDELKTTILDRGSVQTERVDVREIARELVVARTANEPAPALTEHSGAVDEDEKVELATVASEADVEASAHDVVANAHEERSIHAKRSRLKLWKKKLHAMTASLAVSAPEVPIASPSTIAAGDSLDSNDVVVAQTVLETAAAEPHGVEDPVVENVGEVAPQMEATKLEWHQPDDVPSNGDADLSPLTKLPTKIEWADSEDDTPSADPIIQAVSPLEKAPRKIEWTQPADDIPSTGDVFEAAADLAKAPRKIEWTQPDDDIPSTEDVFEAAAELAKAPRKTEWTQSDDGIPSTGDALEAASSLSKTPTKIAWSQPEDDIPSMDDVLEANSPLAATPKKIEWDQPEDLPSMHDVLEAAASMNGHATKVQWEQPDDDIPSIDAVREARSSDGLNPEPIAHPQPEPEPVPLVEQDLLVTETINLELAKKVAAMQKKLAAPAVTDSQKQAKQVAKVAKKKPAAIIRNPEAQKATAKPVVAPPPVRQQQNVQRQETTPPPPRLQEKVQQRQAAPQVDGEEITLVRPPRRIKIDLERPESRQVRVSTNRSMSHAQAGVAYIPTILGNKPEVDPNDRAASDPMFAAYYNEPSRRFTIPYRSLAVGGGFMALLALYLVGDGFIGEHVQSKNPNRAALTDKAPVTRVDKQKVVAPAPKPIEKPADVVEEAEYKPLPDTDRLTRTTDKPVKSADSAKSDAKNESDHGRTSKTASVAKSEPKQSTSKSVAPPVAAKAKPTPKKETAVVTNPINTHPANAVRPRIVKVPKS